MRRVRRLNAGRRAALLVALTENLGNEITVVGSDAGLHVVVWVNDVPQAEENTLAARAQAAGLGLLGLVRSMWMHALLIGRRSRGS